MVPTIAFATLLPTCVAVNGWWTWVLCQLWRDAGDFRYISWILGFQVVTSTFIGRSNPVMRWISSSTIRLRSRMISGDVQWATVFVAFFIRGKKDETWSNFDCHACHGKRDDLEWKSPLHSLCTSALFSACQWRYYTLPSPTLYFHAVSHKDLLNESPQRIVHTLGGKHITTSEPNGSQPPTPRLTFHC